MNRESEKSKPCQIADVTVVISTFNRANFLPEAIESILAQHVRPARIVIVDDGSSDETQQVVKPYLLEIEYIRKENGGKARSLNFILPSINTEYTWFFDDDDAAYPEALEHLLTPLDNNPNLGFTFGSFNVSDHDSKLLQAASRPVPYLFANEPISQQRLKLFRDCTVMMSGSLLRTDAIHAVGGLNEALIRGQDYDLMVRLAVQFDFTYCGSAVYVWREHHGVRGSANMQHTAANRLAFWAKYNEPIGYYLRYKLALTRFAIDPDKLDYEQKEIRSALIRRAWALAPKLPLILPVNDIIEAFEIEPSQSINLLEFKLLEDTFHHDFVTYRAAGVLLHLWRLVLTRPGYKALESLSRGLYWIGRKESRLFNRVRFMSVAIVLFCASKLAKVVWMTLPMQKH